MSIADPTTPVQKTVDEALAEEIRETIFAILLYADMDAKRAEAEARFIGKTLTGLLGERGYLKDSA